MATQSQEKSTVTDYSKYSNLPMYPPAKNEKHEKHLRECVVAEFMNLKEPNVIATAVYGTTKQNHKFKFVHGARYRIPRFLKEHMEGLGLIQWKWSSDGHGHMIKSQGGLDPRFQFREVYE